MASRGREPEVRRESRGRHNSSFIRPAKRLAIYLRDRLQCVYCYVDLHDAWKFRDGARPPGHISLGSGQMISLDHLNGREDHGQANLVTACLKCNTTRAGLKMSWRDYLSWVIKRDFPNRPNLWSEIFLQRERSIINARRRKLNITLAKAMIAGRVRADVRAAEGVDDV